jgi:hypothetical protein
MAVWREYDGGLLRFLPQSYAPGLLGKALGSKGRRV